LGTELTVAWHQDSSLDVITGEVVPGGMV
jgi:hypothetical protein